MLRVSFMSGVDHHYVSYDAVSKRFYDDFSDRKNESRLAVRGLAGSSPSKSAKGERSVEYFGGFGLTVGSASVERRSCGNPLRVRLAPTQLRGIQLIDILYSEMELRRHDTVVDVLLHACYATANMQAESRRSPEDLERTC